MMRRNHLYPTFLTVLGLSLVPLILLGSGNRRALVEEIIRWSPYVVSAALGFLSLRLKERGLFYFVMLLGLECALLREGGRSLLGLTPLQRGSAAALSLPLVLTGLFFMIPLLGRRARSFLYPTVVWGPLTVMVLAFQNWNTFTPAMAVNCLTLSLLAFGTITLLSPWMGTRFSKEIRIFSATASLPVLWLLSQIIRKGMVGRELELAVPLSFLSAQFVTAAVVFRIYWQKIYLDELTGLPNRRALNETLPSIRSPFCIAMFDVDHFKNFNDEYGHEQGDTVLRFVASVLEKEFGANVYRYGGEEFCALFEGWDLERASRAAEEARARLASREFTIRAAAAHRLETSPKDRSVSGKNKRTIVTVSAGIATDDVRLQRPEDVLIAADAALYRAKQNGRNRVVMAESDRPDRAEAGGRR